MADFEEAGDHDVFRKIPQGFLIPENVKLPDQDIRRAMDELMAQAIAQIKAERLNIFAPGHVEARKRCEIRDTASLCYSGSGSAAHCTSCWLRPRKRA